MGFCTTLETNLIYKEISSGVNRFRFLMVLIDEDNFSDFHQETKEATELGPTKS